MAETITATALCKNCGADIREGSLFCYSCGKAVANGADASESETFEKAATSAETSAVQKSKMRSAADIERRKRQFSRKPVEITWMPRHDGANSFVIIALIVTILAAILVIAALYYR